MILVFPIPNGLSFEATEGFFIEIGHVGPCSYSKLYDVSRIIFFSGQSTHFYCWMGARIALEFFFLVWWGKERDLYRTYPTQRECEL